MKYLKLYENFRWSGDIMRLSNYNWKDANLSQDPVPIENVNKILNIITKKHEYNVNNKGSWNNNLIISFSDPKIFNSMKFRIHEYIPAEIRYYLRIYQFQYYWGDDEDIYMVQWISSLFATKDHIRREYSRYQDAVNKLGSEAFQNNKQKLVDDGIDYWNNEEEKWKPLYRPPIYKGIESLSKYGLDGESETYICRDLFALFDLIDDFQEFLDNKEEHYFKTNYPSI